MKKADWDAMRRAFAARYLATGNAYQSALAAGYAPHTARAKSYVLPRDPTVVAEMHRLLLAGGQRPREVGGGNIAEAVDIPGAGGAWPRGTMGGVGLEFAAPVDGPGGGDGADIGGRVLRELARVAFDDSTDFTAAGRPAGGSGRFKGSTKLRALELLARAAGLFERDGAQGAGPEDGGFADAELDVRAASLMEDGAFGG